jgi:3-hydroxybutyrate dehydrogenase
MQLNNQVAVITGAASGIGRDIAIAYAREGAIVCITDLNENDACETARAIERDGGRAFSLAMDVTDENEVNNGIDHIAHTYGSIDILISNAGIQHIARIDQLTYQTWQKLLAIHLDGAFLTTRACLKHMYQQRSGSIIYIGSVHSKEASPLKAPYVTAKHGLLGLCRTVAQEGANYNVRTNVICPGFVKTPLVEKQIPEQAEKLNLSEEEVIQNVFLKDTVDGEFTTSQDITECAVFLGAYKSKALTGQSLIVSHGWHLE